MKNRRSFAVTRAERASTQDIGIASKRFCSRGRISSFHGELCARNMRNGCGERPEAEQTVLFGAAGQNVEGAAEEAKCIRKEIRICLTESLLKAPLREQEDSGA